MVNHDILHLNRTSIGYWILVSVIPLEEYLKIFLCVLEITTLSLPTMLH
jgi:hypothetical protein